MERHTFQKTTRVSGPGPEITGELEGCGLQTRDSGLLGHRADEGLDDVLVRQSPPACARRARHSSLQKKNTTEGTKFGLAVSSVIPAQAGPA